MDPAFQFIKSKIRNRLHHTRAEKSQFVAINTRLSQKLDEEDDGFGYCTWKHDVDDMYDSFLKEALAEQDNMEKDHLPSFNCWEEDWELDVRAQNNATNQFLIEGKLQGMWFYDDGIDPGDGSVNEEAIGYYIIKRAFMQKNARGANKVWNGKCHKMERNGGGDGEWTPVLDSKGKVLEEDYLLNFSIYPMIKAAWELNEERFRLVEKEDEEHKEEETSAEH